MHSRRSLNPLNEVDLSPLHEADKKYRQEQKLHAKRLRIAQKLLKDQGLSLTETELYDIEVSECSDVDRNSDSGISEDGVPEAKLKFVVEPEVFDQIEQRRQNRFVSKVESRIDHEAINSIVRLTEGFH